MSQPENKDAKDALTFLTGEFSSDRDLNPFQKNVLVVLEDLSARVDALEKSD
jgi:hypothetical protein